MTGRLTILIRRALALAILALPIGCGMPAPIRVMSFNIRYGTASDGENRWDRRADLVFDTIRTYAPSILGLQEVLAFQAEALCAALPDYEFVGVGRDDGEAAGEFAPILFHSKTFELIDRGHFWLSETPDAPGSVGWDAALPRIATWTRLRFRKHPLNEILVINTHFDHRGKRARIESAKILRRLVETMGGTPIVLLGDFNSPPGSQVPRILTEPRGNLAELHDAFARNGQSETGVGTHHGFRGNSDGARIDWIMHSRRFETLEMGIERGHRDGRYPSDHFPVTATLRLRAGTRFGWL